MDGVGLATLGWTGDFAAALAALAAGCRFADCAHDHEPGCAVRVAVAAGELDPARLAAWRRLVREARSAEIRADPLAREQERRRWRTIRTSVGRHMRAKYGEGTRR